MTSIVGKGPRVPFISLSIIVKLVTPNRDNVSPFVNSRTTLAYIDNVPSVTTRNGIFAFSIRNPLMNPMRQATPMAPRQASIQDDPLFMIIPRIIEATAVADAADKSNPAVKTTTVAPIARMKTTACARTKKCSASSASSGRPAV
jgi:hypothetical protein